MWVLQQTDMQSHFHTLEGSRAFFYSLVLIDQLNEAEVLIKALEDFPHILLPKDTHTSMVRSLRKSLCSGFSTSTTPHG